MYILGINESHLATASLLKDGEIIACASEERFTRKKNQGGFPFKAMQFCLREAGINLGDLDLIVFGYTDITGSILYGKIHGGRKGVLFLSRLKEWLFDNFYFLYQIFPPIYYLYKAVKFFIHKATFRLIREVYLHKLSKKLKFSKKKIIFMIHHNAHAYAAYYVFAHKEKSLVITNDGSGDNYSGKVFRVTNGRFNKIAVTPNDFSLAYLYYYVTKFLGFIPDEEEYKVMGLAPYANSILVNKIYPIFKELFVLKNLSFISNIPRELYYGYLRVKLRSARFDAIAGATQRLTEELAFQQVEKAILKTKVREVNLGGGLAMNIKANLKISKIDGLKSLQVCPSSGDESTSIGCCYFGYQRLCFQRNLEFKPQPLANLYLGPGFGNSEILVIIKRELDKRKYKTIKLTKEVLNARAAKLLAKGKILARFAGRMEFGARTLGNRSILADPRDTKIIRILNDQIKGRDFWMPFAPTILYERVDDYLINPKKIYSPFMMIGFEVTEKAKKEIPAALHPYDFTCRPQMLVKQDNSEYYDLIKSFEQITGVGAILNTSFNLHGEPIVCTPEDAISTFKKSGLEYLLLEDFLIQKVVNE